MNLGQTTPLAEQTIRYPFDKVTPWNLVEYMLLVQKRKGLEPPFEIKVHLRGMKKLLEECGEEKTIALILRAGEVSSFPFSIKFLKEFAKELYER